MVEKFTTIENSFKYLARGLLIQHDQVASTVEPLLKGHLEFLAQMSSNGIISSERWVHSGSEDHFTTISPFYLAPITGEKANNMDIKGYKFNKN